MSPLPTSDDLFRKLILAIGFLAVGVSVLIAHSNPAAGYEISIYTMTPPLVWVGLLLAMSTALAVAFVPPSERKSGRTSIALVLGGLVMAVFAGLPIIRGYRFYGHHDALTHLGWARAISEGTILPFDLYYPGIHTVTAIINSVFGFSMSQSMLIVVLVPVLVFFIFVPLCVGAIIQEQRAVTIATFSGFLLLPITTISMYMNAHAMTQTVLLSSMFLYLTVKYLRVDRDNVSATAGGMVLFLASISLVIYHPQLVAHLTVVLLGISGVQYIANRVSTENQIITHTPMYGQTLFLIGIFVLWTSNHGFFADIAAYFFRSAVEFLFIGGEAGDSVATQGASLDGAGGSLMEIFFKLFFPHLIFTLLIMMAVFGVLINWDRFKNSRYEIIYFTVGLVGLSLLFAIYFVASGSLMYFRVFGLMMLFGTILGSISLHCLTADRCSEADRFFSISTQTVFAAGFALLLVLSLMAVFPSPYTYNESPHVSEMQLEGYETAFDTRDDNIDFVGLRNGPNRHDDAVNGNEERMRLHLNIDESMLDERLATQLENDRYLALTQSDYEREIHAYNELRYTEDELDSLSVHPTVDRIQSNGEFELYYVNAETTST
ncbi:MFS transporter [Natronolimnohabitans sp. A-GB9]|uniref:MFS transporter n=1 Tax=Natronolimnohabitans sp. A-GB9 TaxID=3069757 RepID=UPI0027B291C6|nr:MFS transporter [Natronolimnohabitans sp. A-GB9]MDQ2052032.1 MFS transporter [Natronolimnohabitans sp. A-GB9]